MNQATNILTALDGAHLVQLDQDSGTVFAWFGGPNLNRYAIEADGLDCIEQIDALIVEACASCKGSGKVQNYSCLVACACAGAIATRMPTIAEVRGLIAEALDDSDEEEGDAECTECGDRFHSAEGHPTLALCAGCAEDVDPCACPGCGCLPGEGRTPGCTDEDGCGCDYDDGEGAELEQG